VQAMGTMVPFKLFHLKQDGEVSNDRGSSYENAAWSSPGLLYRGGGAG
jgi:hypothetical protein